MLRLHFSAQDLARTRFSPVSDPFLETVLGAEMARQRRGGLLFRRWHHGLRGRLGPDTKPLTQLITRQSRGLDLPTLVGSVGDIATARDRFLGLRREDVQRELDALVEAKVPEVSFNVAAADREGRREFGDAIVAFHDIAIRPHWPRIDRVLQAEKLARLRCIGSFGLGHMLATLCPAYVRWNEPVLEVDTATGRRGDLDLAGRGLVLVPSVFVGGKPYIASDLANPAAPPYMVYPVVRDLTGASEIWAAAAGSAPAGLAGLLGRTRSAVLEAVIAGHGTGEIARQLGVSAATVSEHVSILRTAGLLTTRRDGGTTLHMLTTAGEALLGKG